MVIWTARHRAFVVEAFFQSGYSVNTTQRLFRTIFNVPRHGAVRSPNTITLIIPYDSNKMGSDLIQQQYLWICWVHFFPEHVILQNGNVQWPARFPNLTACDYFLWGFLMNKVYVTMPTNVNKLKHRISEEILAIQPDLIRKVMESLTKWMCEDWGKPPQLYSEFTVRLGRR